MCRNRISLPLLLLALGTADRHVEAQSVDEPVPNSGAATEDFPVDEIIVIGDKSPTQLRREIRLIESRIYSIFNDHNDDNSYDIVCRRRAPIGSQIARKNCKARLYWDALSDASEDEGQSEKLRNVVANKDDHTARLREIMQLLASENAELMNALIERRRLATELEQAEPGSTDDQDLLR